MEKGRGIWGTGCEEGGVARYGGVGMRGRNRGAISGGAEGGVGKI